jgi:hypothetical protein
MVRSWYGLPAILAVLLLALAPLSVLQAQTGTVTGRILTEAGTPLAGAHVSLIGTDRGVITNARGAYLMLGVPAGTHTVRVRSIGYGTEEATVSVEAGGTATQNFTLRQEAVALQEIIVTVGSRVAGCGTGSRPAGTDPPVNGRVLPHQAARDRNRQPDRQRP